MQQRQISTNQLAKRIRTQSLGLINLYVSQNHILQSVISEELQKQHKIGLQTDK